MKLSRRRFLAAGAATAASLSTFPAPALIAAGANDHIRLGSISCGGRANQLLREFTANSDVDVMALCDPDSDRLGVTAKKFNVSKRFVDPRRLLEEKEIDAVIVATCNHWHCLAAIWAMEAGKEVYVEKPLAHNQWEGAQTVRAARKYKRICQVGTQQRSDPMQAEIKKFLHEDKTIGKILYGRVNHFAVRKAIGRREQPLEIPAGVDYNLWLGPAEEKPLYRNKLQYDWHWDWNTGCGEMGNWGVHVLDDARNNILRDSVVWPKGVMGGGTRAVWNDAGETPNLHFAFYETGSIPLVLALSNLEEVDNPKSAGECMAPRTGYIAYAEGGRLEGTRGHAAAFDKEGKKIRDFDGTGGQSEHVRNFLDAVKAGDSSLLNAEVAVGNASTGWCNLANVVFRAGKPYSKAEAVRVSPPTWNEAVESMEKITAGYGIEMEKTFRFTPLTPFDGESEQFTGENADALNVFYKRTYRHGFEVPEV